MTVQYVEKNWLKRLLLALIFVVPLSACNPWEDDKTYTNQVGGSVGDGPVVGATVTVYSINGAVLGTQQSDSTATYKLTVKAKGKDYPLRLVASGGTDLVTGSVPDFEMVSVVAHPSEKKANINPFSTLIVKSAEAMPGGLSAANVGSASGAVMNVLGFGLSSSRVPDPVTTDIDNTNIADIVKASEMMGEMVRRTRDLMAGTGAPTSGDTVMDALAHDLTDGRLDGQGGPAANAAIAAVTNVVAGQVLLEAASNSLKVGGAVATQVLDMSIISTHAGVSGSQLTGNVRIGRDHLDQLETSIAAARVLDPGQALANIAATVSGLAPDLLPGQVAATLSVSQAAVLDNSLVLATVATSAEIDAVNAAADGGSTNTGSTNVAPQISGNPVGSVTANSSYSFQPSASDADGDALTFSISSKPSWANFNTGNGRLSGTPSDQHAGTYGNIAISVSDGTASASLGSFAIQVTATPVVNTPPVISGSAAGQVTANSSYSFQPSASDADGDALTFSISNKPSWASFNAGTGRLSGTPSDQHAGTYGNIVVSVFDGTDAASLAAFSIQVAPAPVINTPPVISGSPAGSVFSNSGYVFQPSASDADGDALTFSISNKPSWASFNTGNGRLSGTPSDQHAGTYGNIAISVSDGTASASLGSFAIQVVPAPVVNTPPVISGSAAGQVTANSSYSFQPSASDADSDALTFSISNKPSWASFNTGTGRLSGTPSDQHAGTYGSIVITVTDGTDAVSLPGFSIQVDPSLGSFSLSWSAPVMRADGSALSLSDIDSYRIYYGTTAGSYTNSVTITDGSTTSATISNIQNGTWHVVMTTIDSSGLESAQSGAITKVAN